MGLFDKLKDQALNSINELGGIQKETVNNEQNQQAPMAPPPPPQAPVVQSPTPQVAEKGDDESMVIIWSTSLKWHWLMVN